MTLPPVTFTIDPLPVEMEGWSFNDAEGGHDQLSGNLAEDDYRRADSPTQGATVQAWSGGQCVWAGRINSPPQIRQGVASFAAVGFKEKAEKKNDRLLIQSADIEQWVPADSDPHLDVNDIPIYDHIRKMDLSSHKGALRFALTKDQNLTTGDASAFVFYAEGINLERVKWTQTYATADEFAKLDIRVQRANGPTGAASNVTTVLLNPGNNGSQQAIAMGAVNDLVTVGLHCNDGTFAPNANRMTWTLVKVRVNSDITTGDSFSAWEVIDYIGDQLGFDTSGIDQIAFDVLPFDWQDGSWWEAARYVAELQDCAVRVGAPTTVGPLVEYDDWGSLNTWTVYMTDGVDPDLKPLELFNRARVFYETPAGVLRSRRIDVTPDPLAASGILNTYEYELEDRQKSSTIADAVATKLAARFATQRYSGTLNVTKAVSADGDDNPRDIRYGDTITIADWAPGQNLTMRVMEVQQTPTEVQIGVEQPINLAYLVDHVQRRRRRRRRRRHHR